MSRKPENTFIAGVHKYLPRTSPYRVKMSNPYAGGLPDWWYSGDKNDLWVEYKYIPTIPKVVVPNLSMLQLLWLNSRFTEGRNVYVVIGSQAGGVIFDQTTWDQGITREVFLERMLTRQSIALWIHNFTGD